MKLRLYNSKVHQQSWHYLSPADDILKKRIAETKLRNASIPKVALTFDQEV